MYQYFHEDREAEVPLHVFFMSWVFFSHIWDFIGNSRGCLSNSNGVCLTWGSNTSNAFSGLGRCLQVKRYACKHENLGTGLKLGTHICNCSVPIVINNTGQTRRIPGSSQSSEAGIYSVEQGALTQTGEDWHPYPLTSTCLPWKCMPVLIHMITHIHTCKTEGGRQGEREKTVFQEAEVELRLCMSST